MGCERMAARTHVVVVDGTAVMAPPSGIDGRIRVLFCCTGVGIFNRGIESFFRQAFDALKSAPDIDARLIKGGGDPSADECVAACLPRTSRIAEVIGPLFRRNAYVVEQLSSLPSVVRYVRTFRPHVVFYSDSNLGFQLYRWRKQIGVPFRLLFSNGGPCHPPFDRTDFVHQVAPFYHEEALQAGELAQRHFMVPYGLDVGPAPALDPSGRRSLRSRLGMPLDGPVVLTVGWISRQHKRMHYVIEELARLPKPRPYLQMLGAMDASSDEVVALAETLLGRDGFSARSVPYVEVADYYRAADLFVLASLQEGFGRVYLEALSHGLPVIAHRHPVTEYVLGDCGYLADLSKPDELTGALATVLTLPLDQHRMTQRWASVRDRFSWKFLAPQYMRMFAAAAGVPARSAGAGVA